MVRASLLGLLAALAACSTVDDADETDGDDGSALTAGVRSWDASAESEYSNWIAKIGTARAEGRCTTLNACINDRSINSLKGASDANLNLFADCADVPMELRAYFSVKTNRVFAFVSAIASTGPDARYGKDNQPTAHATAASSRTMQALMTKVSDSVHSGFFRMAPEVEGTDTYPIKPSRASLRPGTVYYDPNGHVLVVYRVDADGSIWTFDGHPDNSLTYGRFTEGTYALGSRPFGGGFRDFRPQRLADGTVTYATNAELADFGDNQYGHGNGYFDWLVTSLGGTPASPDQKFNSSLDQLCIDLQARIASVDAGRALASGVPAPIPANIYSAEGDWEAFSTPSRDARLRAGFRNMFRFVQSSLDAVPAGPRGELAAKLVNVWRAHQASPKCGVRYTDTNGGAVSLTLEDIQARIYDLSFDPYHCPEMRWGAYPRGGAEIATCNPDAEHIARFDAERRNRNVIDRDDATATGPDYGPDAPADIDVAGLLRRRSGL